MREGDAVSFATELDASTDMLAMFAQQAKNIPLKDLNLLLSNYSYAYFAQRYLPHIFFLGMSERLHGVLFKTMRMVETHTVDTPVVIAGPREAGKSTIINLLEPLHALYFPALHLLANGELTNMAKRYIVFMGSTQKMASRLLSDLSTELEQNDRLRYELGDLYLDSNGKPPHTRPWNKSLCVTNSNRIIEAYGRNSKHRGLRYGKFRPDQLNADDTEDDTSVRSLGKREADTDWVNRVLRPMAASKNGNIVLSGTLLRHNSMLTRFVEYGKQHGWPVHVMRVYEDTPDGREYLWPERFSEEWIQRTQAEMPMSAFEAEYLQNPTAGSSDLSPEDFTYYALSDIENMLDARRFIVAIGVDPACKTGEHNDYTAIVTVALDPTTGIRYVLPITLDRLKLAGKVEAIFNTAIRWRAHDIGIEDVQFQIALKEAVDMRAREANVILPTTPVSQKGDKALRITRLVPAIKNGTIRFLREREHAVVVDQLIHIYNTDYDDGADALEIANRQLDAIALRRTQQSNVAVSIQ